MAHITFKQIKKTVNLNTTKNLISEFKKNIFQVNIQNKSVLYTVALLMHISMSYLTTAL